MSDSEGSVVREEMHMADAEEAGNRPSGLAARAAVAPAPASGKFHPSRYLTKVGGGDYLEVKWRLVWFREVHPEGGIVTELISHTDQFAMFKATITTGRGGIAISHGSETRGDHGDYSEKAETKAIGRALGSLGFGTQFSYDFTEDAGRYGGIADSPVNRPSGNAGGGQQSSNAGGGQQSGGQQSGGQQSGGRVASDKQIKFLTDLAADADLAVGFLEKGVQFRCQTTLDKMPGVACSAWIKMLKEGVDGGLAQIKDWCDLGSKAETVAPVNPATGLPAMSAEAKAIWLTKIANSTTTAQLEAINDLLEQRHGVIPTDVDAALVSRFNDVDASVPY